MTATWLLAVMSAISLTLAQHSTSILTVRVLVSRASRIFSAYPFQFKIQFYALPFASYIQRKLNLRVTSRIRRTRPPLRHYVITITSSRGPNGGSSALPRPSSYTAAPRRTAPGPSNFCPSYLTTFITIHSSYGCLVKKKKEYVKDRCEELERSASHFLGPTDHF